MSLHLAKIIDQDESKKMLYMCKWLVAKTVRFKDLTIHEYAEIVAPEGKVVTLLVDGIPRNMKPGRYMGDVVLAVSDEYISDGSRGMMSINNISSILRTAICVEDGKLVAEKSIPEAVWGGRYDAKSAEGMYLGCDCDNFNGIIIKNSDYAIKNIQTNFEGFGFNDYIGVGAAVLVDGESNVILKDSVLDMMGVTRCVIHTDGNSKVLVENCDITNFSPFTDWVGQFCWNINLTGTCRLVQLCDHANVTYKNCRLKTNGWGIFSIDNFELVKLNVIDCELRANGPRSHAYGAFCMGPTEVLYDGVKAYVDGYPLWVMGYGEVHGATVKNSLLKGRRFGIIANSDFGSTVKVSDTTIETDRACIAVKGSFTTFELDNVTMHATDGTLIQVQDNMEECTMSNIKNIVPVGIADTPIEGKDLVTGDVIVGIANSRLEGNIYNSSTNLHMERQAVIESKGAFHDAVLGPTMDCYDEEMGPPNSEYNGRMLHDPKNLALTLKNTSIKGIISSALQFYRDGVEFISPINKFEVGNITQEAAPTVNNGVTVALDADSAWIVTGTSYITKLEISNGAEVAPLEGKTLTLTVDGKETPIAAGTYQGKIVLTVA